MEDGTRPPGRAGIAGPGSPEDGRTGRGACLRPAGPDHSGRFPRDPSRPVFYSSGGMSFFRAVVAFPGCAAAAAHVPPTRGPARAAAAGPDARGTGCAAWTRAGAGAGRDHRRTEAGTGCAAALPDAIGRRPERAGRVPVPLSGSPSVYYPYYIPRFGYFVSSRCQPISSASARGRARYARI